MSGEPTLDRVQRWMLSVITDPRGIAAGIATDAAQREIPVAAADLEAVIPRSQACTSIERLAVYGNAYFARLLECLQAEYDIVAKAAGEEAFLSLAAGYLQAYPPTSYTLGQLGAKFPQYLEETRPPRTAPATAPDWADFLIDLARLERTYSEVFDGPGEEGRLPLDVAVLQDVPLNQQGNLRLQFTQSLRLMALRFPVHATYAAIRQGGESAPPSPRPVRLAIYRRNYVVQRRELLPEQATLLAAFQRGITLSEGLEAMVVEHSLAPAAISSRIGAWFREFTAAGMVRGVR